MQSSELCVLLIEDDPITRDALTELLETEKFTLHTAKDSTEGLLKITNGVRPNIVIVDVRKPNTTGVETIQRIRQFTGLEVHAILLTDKLFDEEIKKANLNKCIVLHKPQDINLLPNRIHEMVA